MCEQYILTCGDCSIKVYQTLTTFPLQVAANLMFTVFAQYLILHHAKYESFSFSDSKCTKLYLIKTHGSVSCGPRSRRATPVSILTGRTKMQFSHLRSSVLPS